MSTRIPAERARPNLVQTHRALQLCSYAGAAILLTFPLAEPGHHTLKTVIRFTSALIITLLH